MNVILFGATGMVGQGVLLECLREPAVERVLVVVRSGTGRTHAKLREIVHGDLLDLSAIESRLAGFDACFFCLGVSSVGMGEEAYRRVTFDITLAVAQTLLRLNPGMAFIFVSGSGADSSGSGPVMWKRIKGLTENALLRLPFKTVAIFRPGLILPQHGVTSRTRLYRLIYPLLQPFGPLLHAAFPRSVTTTARIGRAMLGIARNGSPKAILTNSDINILSQDAKGVL